MSPERAATAVARCEADGPRLRVRLSGEVTLERAAAARKTLLEAAARGQDLVIDLEHVVRIDTAGLAVLVETLQAVCGTERELRLAHVGEQPQRMLQLARLDEVFEREPA